jgi:amino acid adenylation domain-containing protein
MQVIEPAADLSWHETEAVAGLSLEELLDALFDEESAAAHDLRRGPPLHARLVGVEADEHVLMLTLPALCADAETLKRMVRQLGRYYSAALAGEEIRDEVMQYADLSEWQNELLEGEESKAGRQFWRGEAGADSQGRVFPFEGQGCCRAFESAHISVPIDEATAEAVERLASLRGAGVSDVLLACWQALLGRLSGRPALTVCAAFDGRKYEEFADAFGLFIRYLPVRVGAACEGTFAGLLGRVREAVAGAGEWQEYFDWEEYLRSCGLDAEGELAAAAFEFDGSPNEEQRSGGPTFRVSRLYSLAERFGLRLACARGADGRLNFELHFDVSRFNAEDVRRLGEGYAALLASAAVSPEADIEELEILGESERCRVLDEWNQTAREYPRGLCAHQLFEAQARRTPDAVAVVFGDERLTYAELEGRANQLARRLRALGVGADSLVGLCVERSAEMVVALLGVLKAGGAYLPLDAAYPKERLSFMLEDSGVSVLLTQERLADSLPAHGARLVRLDADWKEVARESAEGLPAIALPASLAYVIYTSGSTGRPKGVMVSHGGLVNYLSWCAAAYATAEGEGSPVHSPLGFDLTVTSLFSPLVSGRRVVLLPESRDIDGLVSALRTGGDFGLVKITPAHLEALAARLPAAEAAGRARTFVIGGEALRRETLAFWRRHAPATRLINEYGPTETVVGCCVYEAAEGDPEVGTVPIGNPIANTRLYVLDHRGQPVPTSFVGELYIGGASVARGYLNRPALTAERFVPDPFTKEPGARVYRTGDLVRRLADGRLEFIGRLDHQVKVRGYRIELGEVESALASHAALRQCVAVAREDSPGERRLVAYVVTHEGVNASVSSLREHLCERLPEYMVPSAFVVLERLPLTSNGKVDREALPVPEGAGLGLRGSVVAPRDTLELQLMELWEKVLNLKRVGVTENFFDIGGNSLSAVRLMAQVYKLFGKELPLATLLEHGTIEKLAALLHTERDGAPWSPVVEIQPRGTRRPIFFVHPSGGGVLGYIHLSRRLGTDQPFYGLQNPGLSGETPHTGIEELAGCYVEALRRVQPEGPYQLGGWSLGGLIAYEMAQQLAGSGESVGLLALLDTKCPVFKDAREEVEQTESLAELAAALMSFCGRNVLSLHDDLRGLADEEQLPFLLEEMKKAHIISPGTGLVRLRRFVEVYSANMTAAINYKPRPYGGRVTLFRASEITPELFNENPKVWGDEALGWRDFAADAEIVKVPGFHDHLIFEPNVRVIAERLDELTRETAPEELVGAAG